MSQTDIETPDRKAPETQNSEGSDLFSEVLFSGKEIEGLFEKKRREEMLSNSGKKSGKKRGANGVKDPLTILKERVAIYNRKLEDEFHLVLVEEVSQCRYIFLIKIIFWCQRKTHSINSGSTLVNEIM